MTDTTTTKARTITLTDRPPVTIREDQWPIIATGDWGDSPNGIRSQSNREATIRVREHEDGRRIVYGVYSSQWQGERGAKAGVLIAADGGKPDTDATIRAIHDVATSIDAPSSCARECIADLPAEEL